MPNLGVGVHNGLTARLVDMAGFDLVWLGSLEVATSRGLPDRNLITSPEVASLIAEVRSATSLPIFVDGDNGYGSDLAAARAAVQFESAQAHTLVIEDSAFPKENSLAVERPHHLLDPDVFVGRLESVLAARSQMRVVARTEALIAGLGVAEAVYRLEKYAATGVDGLFVQVNAHSRDLLFPVLDELRGVLPFVLAPTALPEMRASEFADHGVETLLFANVVVRRLVAALSESLRDLRDTQCLGELHGVAPVADVLRMMDSPLMIREMQWGRVGPRPG